MLAPLGINSGINRLSGPSPETDQPANQDQEKSLRNQSLKMLKQFGQTQPSDQKEWNHAVHQPDAVRSVRQDMGHDPNKGR